MQLQGKVSVITGGASGIGLACAQRFAQEGASVVLADINPELGASALQGMKEYGARVSFRACDVSQSDQLQALFDFAVAQYGRLDNLIANAGIARPTPILEMTEQDLDTVLNVNLKGVVLSGQLAARIMVKQAPDSDGSRGTIINMSSVNAVMTIPAIASYCVAKGGVNQWTKCLALGLATENVRVNGIGPGSINTPMFASVANNPEKLKAVLSRTPMGRPGEADEIAKVAVFLASHYSSYMTGQTLYPDGGRLGLNYTVSTA